MPAILHIESSTRVCSVGVSKEGRLLALREDHSQDYSHSALLVPFIQQVLREAGLKPKNLNAVALSRGPGSYTGLRIGTSSAKGFCYGLDIPLIPLDTMKSMAQMALLKNPNGIFSGARDKGGRFLLCPMIDARRMEVYHGFFNARLERVEEVKATVVDSDSFRDHLESNAVYFFGDGASKCREVLDHPNAFFPEGIWPSAEGMVEEAEALFAAKAFADLAYFEPFYLKDFVAGRPRVKGLYP